MIYKQFYILLFEKAGNTKKQESGFFESGGNHPFSRQQINPIGNAKITIH
jgi:hypothetical protein